MPKNNADSKKDRSDNRADVKNSPHNYDHFTEEHPTLKDGKTADYPASLNGFPKNEG
ncbi:hypothetical protein KIH86_11040 [Paenibacillus sp. HN-1]|uniref:hypothetical protein n=1 Tax=Paenibacillus TaxID=44249 RepID=UPI001CA80271|nr:MULTISPECIES: hypothetical protein [Paenibacillus]MBY9077466.1 hypothetical protein [Paenibacillus sp. CGMCC 1.18879]MBY9084757.1 hypothetical protein [Paenibacillus sinensis]